LAVTGATTLAGLTAGAVTATSLNNTPVGNATPSTGSFTTLINSGVHISNGNIVAASGTASTSTTTGALVVAGGVGISGAVFIGGNLSVAGTLTYLNTTQVQITGTEVVAGTLTANSTNTSTSTTSGALQVAGGAGIVGNIYAGSIQATPIGSYTPSTGAFTTLNATGAAALSTVTAYGIQATAIGNVTPGTGAFTTLSSSGAATLNSLVTTTSANVGGNLIVGAGSTFSGDLIPSANVTYNLGSSTNQWKTLWISGSTIQIGGVAVTAAPATGVVMPAINSTPIGNATPSTGAFTTLSSSGASTLNSLGVTNNATVGGTLGVTGATTLGTLSVTNETDTGNLTVSGGLQATAIGNVTPGTAAFTTLSTSGAATLASASITGNATVGGNATVTGNLVAANFTTSGSNGNITINPDGTGQLIVTSTTPAVFGNTLNVSGNITASGSAGVITPNRPAFRVYGSSSTIWSTTTNTNGILNANNWTVDYNQGGYLNSSTGVFTAPVAGLYQLNLVCRVANNTSPSAQAIVIKNYGSGNVNQIMWESGANPSINHFGVSTVSKLAAGDTLTLKIAVGSLIFDSNDNWSVVYLG